MKIEKNITVCFDSNIYDSTNYDFEGKFYTTFKGLKKSYPNLRVYIEPIIYNEVLSHLRDRAIDITKAVESLSKQTRSLDLFSDAIETLKIEDLESQCFTEYEEKFEEFIKFFSDEEIDKTFNYEMSDILSDYFKGLPPFENKKSKKNEFPDALIIQGLKNKFQNQGSLYIVSSDKGFSKAVKDKIPSCKIFNNYPDCADYLNKRLEKYLEAYQIVEELVGNIARRIRKHFEELIIDFTATHHAASKGFIVDVTNYDRRDYTELYPYDEVIIRNLFFDDYHIKILDIKSDTGRVIAEIRFILRIEISGCKEDSDDLISESHTISYKVDIEVDPESKELINMSDVPIVLNNDSLINRTVERDYYENNYDDYAPSLHPESEIYTITCDNCHAENNYDAPSMEEFEISSSERSMGSETVYELTIQENCGYCDQEFILKIILSMYPYLVLEVDDIDCEGGETDLSFVVS